MSHTLNQAQKQAVEYTDGPLLIVAGAGTGKTTVITEKIAYLIKNQLARPEEILALTFTDKAASEMKDRVDSVIDTGYADMQISTFHSFCQRLLENHGLDIGLPNQFKLLTETDAWMLVRKNLVKFDLDYYRPLGNPTRHVHELLKHFSKCKDELITPPEYLSHSQDLSLNTDNSVGDQDLEIEIKRVKEVANAYQVYNQLLLDHSALDFGDLIFYTIKLLTERPNVLKALQAHYRYILVDEFQDVNWAQYQLVQMLSGEKSQLTVVGDDDQSIYAFRGASVSNILRFKEDYPTAKEIVLNENYRSAQEILDRSYDSIQNNNPDRLEVKLKINKRLVSQVENRSKKSTEAVVHLHADTLENEAQAVVTEILRLKSIDSEATWDDFAILVRARNHADPFVAHLASAHIPYEFIASSGLYLQPIILDSINFLKSINNYHESTAIYRLLRAPFWNFEESDMHLLTNYAKKKAISYYEALGQSAIIGLSKSGQEIANRLINLIKLGSQEARDEKTSVVLYKFFSNSGYLEYLAQAENKNDQAVIRQIYQLKQFFDYILSVETTNPDTVTVANFLAHYEMVLESESQGELYQPTDSPDSVNIMTIHKAKGLEFKYVFVVNLVEDRFPSRNRSEAIEIPSALIKEQLPEGDGHTQEERRLFYVALTRAKKQLYLTSATDYGGARAKKISRFLNELGFVVKTDAESKKEKASDLVVGTDLTNDSLTTDLIYELPAKFSFSQIKAYETCPYQYKLANILHLPTGGSGVFSFGQTIHGVLQEFYTRVQRLNSAKQDSLFEVKITTEKLVESGSNKIKVPTLDELLSIYEEKWIGDWYQDKLQREKYFEEGKKFLVKFYKNNQDNWTIPVRLEGWFTIKIGGHTVHGRIDRIDQLADGSLEIIDYKTGRAKEKLTADDKDQLLIYQIAATQLPEYRHLGEVQKLTFYYINEGAKLSFLGTAKELTKIQEKVVEIIDKIKSRNFTATPSEHHCKHCDFRDICEFRA